MACPRPYARSRPFSRGTVLSLPRGSPALPTESCPRLCGPSKAPGLISFHSPCPHAPFHLGNPMCRVNTALHSPWALSSGRRGLV